jgi:hypothetical protein
MPVVTFTAGQVLTAAQLNQIGSDSGWLQMSTFTNTWTGNVYYRKVGTLVTLAGSISGGTVAAAFTLPSGYRPSSLGGISYYFPSIDVNGTTTNTVRVQTTGVVTPSTTSTVQLQSVQFYTD